MPPHSQPSSFNNEHLANIIELNEITTLETDVTLPILQAHGWHVAAAADHIFRHGHEETATETAQTKPPAAFAFITPTRVKGEPTELMTPTSRLAELPRGIMDLSENTTTQTTIGFMLPGEQMTSHSSHTPAS